MKRPFPGYHLWVKVIAFTRPWKIAFFFFYHVIFNSPAELQQKVEEHGVGERGSSCGSALWPSAPLWRYSSPSQHSCIACRSLTLLLASAIFIVAHPVAYYLPVTPLCLFCFYTFPPSTPLRRSAFSDSDILFSTHFSLSVRRGTFFFFFMISHRSTCSDPCLHIYSS